MTGATLPRPPRPPEPANEEERGYIPRDGDSRRKFAKLCSTEPVTLDSPAVATQSMLGNYSEPFVLPHFGVQGYIPSRSQQDLRASGPGSAPWTVTAASAHPHLAVYDVDYPPVNETAAYAGTVPRIETANPSSRFLESTNRPTSSVTPHPNGAGICPYAGSSLGAGCQPPLHPAGSAFASASSSYFPSTPEADIQAGYALLPRHHPDSPSISALSSSTYPVNVSTPFIPSQSPLPHPIVVNTAANRRRLGNIDLTGRTRQESVPRRPSTSQSTRRVVELLTECQACRRTIGRLALRGGTVDEQDGHSASYSAAFYCSSCVPIPAEVGSVAGPGELVAPPSVDPYVGECTYLDNLSAAVDRYLGEDPDAQDARPPPAPPGKVRTGLLPHDASAGLSKKRRSSVIDVVEGVLACDVCRRNIASGFLKVAATGEPAGASVEVLCAHCESRYTRCSDCGGGGGLKGVGRWRCKEMFPNGRKTCQLAHNRIGTTNEMDYDVWAVESIQPTDRQGVVERCRELFYTYCLGTMGVPDMLESVAPLCRSFEEAEKLCVDAWFFFEPYLTQGPETAACSKRYLALRWATPTSRKKRSKKRDGPSAIDAEEKGSAPSRPVRNGKTLTGFIMAEHNLISGIVHVVLTLPTGAGEAYESSTRLLQTLLARVQEDVVALNAERDCMRLPPYPLLHTAWTLHMTKRDSRIMSRLETRRGFVPLEDFLVKYPEVGLQHFPPQQEVYLPPEFLRGFTIYAKPVRREDLPPDYRGAAVAAVAAVQQQRPSSSQR
ncbi:hypothetical protein JCM8115_001354 [Rhodotorula mucilaginosa]